MYLPRARQDGLTVHDLPEETLVYDIENELAHRLNRTASLVWRHCDGRTSVAQMVSILRQQLGTKSDEAIVTLALEQLSRRNLLESEIVPLAGERRYERREVLRALVAAMVMAPLVMTMRPPKAMAAFSSPLHEDTKCFGDCQTTEECQQRGGSKCACIRTGDGPGTCAMSS